MIRPDGRMREWSIRYSPQGAGGKGRITVTLDDHVQALDLRPGDRDAGATFDRFGLFVLQPGGTYVRVYLDDLTYTTDPPDPRGLRR